MGGEGTAAAWKRPSPSPSLAPLRGRSALRALARLCRRSASSRFPDQGEGILENYMVLSLIDLTEKIR
jgi:hypothetical protein